MHVHKSGATVLTEDLIDSTAVEQCWHYVTGHRRTLLIDRPYQLRVSLFNVFFMAALLTPILASYYFTLTAETNASSVAPELKAFFAAQDLAQFRLVLGSAAVFLLGLFLVTIFETHRTAGAAFAARRQFEAVRQGHFSGNLTLRREDNLAGLDVSFNAMVESLRERTRSEVSQLDTLADELDQAAGGGISREAAARLRLLADQKRANLS